MGSSSLSANRDFRLLWGGQALSSIGTQVSGVAFPLLVLAETGSPAKAGIVGFARTVPFVALALPAGAVADRADRRAVMVTSNAVRAMALLVVAITVAAGRVPYALLFAAAAIDGTAYVFSYTIERGVVRRLVTAEQLPDAIARNESRIFGAALVGPPLGGLLYGIARIVPFLADAVSYVALTASLLLIRTPFQDARTESATGGMREGFAFIWRLPAVRNTQLLFAFSNPVFGSLSLLVLVLARRDGASAALIGLMLGIAACGGLAGALLAPWLQRRLPARVSLLSETWVLTAMLPLMIVTRNAILLGIIVAVAEMITPVTNSIVLTYRVSRTPDELQGRVQAASAMVAFSFLWAGPLVVGALLSRIGSTPTILALTGWMLALAVAASCTPAFRAYAKT